MIALLKQLLFTGVFVTVAFSSCVKDSNVAEDKNYSPLGLNDGWITSVPSNEHVDESKLNEAVNYFFDADQLPLANSLVIIRNGKLIFELYRRGEKKDESIKLGNIQSCTKSICSLLVGNSLSTHGILNLDTSMHVFLPEYFNKYPDKNYITIRDCLTMNDGIMYNGLQDSKDLMQTKESSIDFILKRPKRNDQKFLYSEFSPHLLSALIFKLENKTLSQYAQNVVFNPLKIKQYKWEETNDGLNVGGFSLALSPRDLAKLGQLCLNGGNWNGNQLIPSHWLDIATSKQSSDASYGFLFWINESDFSYQMQGNGGQFVYVNPDKKLVIVYTANAYSAIPLWGNTKPLIEIIKSACS